MFKTYYEILRQGGLSNPWFMTKLVSNARHVWQILKMFRKELQLNLIKKNFAINVTPKVR